MEQSSISTAAIQSFLDAGFRSAAQVGFVVMIGDEGLHPVTKTTWLQSFRNFVLKHAGKSLGSSPGRRPANARGAEQKCRADTNRAGTTRLKQTAHLVPDFAPPSGRSSSACCESSPRPPLADHARIPQRIPGFTADTTDINYVFAYGVSKAMLQVLKQCEGNFTRENIMKQAANLHDMELSTLLPVGWQIALKFAFRGIEVRFQDAFPEALARRVALIEAEIAAVIDSGDSPAESIDAKSRIIACESLASAVIAPGS